MRCRCCDDALTDEELKLRDLVTGMVLDTCFVCLDAQGGATTGDVEYIESLTDIGIDHEYK